MRLWGTLEGLESRKYDLMSRIINDLNTDDNNLLENSVLKTLKGYFVNSMRANPSFLTDSPQLWERAKFLREFSSSMVFESIAL